MKNVHTPSVVGSVGRSGGKSKYLVENKPKFALKRRVLTAVGLSIIKSSQVTRLNHPIGQKMAILQLQYIFSDYRVLHHCNMLYMSNMRLLYYRYYVLPCMYMYICFCIGCESLNRYILCILCHERVLFLLVVGVKAKSSHICTHL
jgi:hypothetical protein